MHYPLLGHILMVIRINCLDLYKIFGGCIKVYNSILIIIQYSIRVENFGFKISTCFIELN